MIKRLKTLIKFVHFNNNWVIESMKKYKLKTIKISILPEYITFFKLIIYMT